MKKYSALLLGICASTFCFNSSRAQANRVYVGADAGGALTSDITIKKFFGPVAPGTKVKLDPGIRFGVVGGYRLTDWFSVEGETGVIGNNIDSITGATMHGDATFSNVPFLANVRLQLPKSRCPVTPYIGAGAGGSASVIDLEHHIDLGGVQMSGGDATVVFAYQAFAGLQYRINDHMSAGVAYHYFATAGPSWEADSSSGTTTDHLRFRDVQSHAITATFEYRF